jgi:hypothetical protein
MYRWDDVLLCDTISVEVAVPTVERLSITVPADMARLIRSKQDYAALQFD